MAAKKYPVSVGLGVLAVGIWLSACLVDTGFSLPYGRSVTSTTVCWWCFAPLLALLGTKKEPAKSKHGLRNAVILALLAVSFACVLWRVGTALLYELFVWQCAALLLSFLLICLFERCHPNLNLRSTPRFYLICASVLAIYIPILLSTLLYVAILHPVSIENIRPVGELEGGRYMGRVTGDQSQSPLGVYFFADGDNWYYYDVLTGEPVQYDDPITLRK